MTDIALFVEHVKSVQDFRKAKGQRYKLHNLLTLMVLAMLSNADDFESMALYCKRKASFLISLNLLDGKNYPSHDLFRWIMLHIDKSTFGSILIAWLESTELDKDKIEENNKRNIHIDGKVLRASRTAEHSRTGLLVLNAYCSDNYLTIGSLLGDKKSCEKTLLPKLLPHLYLQNAVVTIDAIGTMTHVAAAIVDKKGDYILALKKNNKHFFNEVSDFFYHFEDSSLIVDIAQSVDNQGKRTDIRTCSIITDLRFFPDAKEWKNLKTLVCLKTQRTLNGKTVTEQRFYLSSLPYDAKALMEAIRRHWHIENKLHWHLDVAFNEDKSRLREHNAALCLAVLRRFALTILKRSHSKESIKAQRLALAWDDSEILNLLKSINTNDLQFK
jgi:predicted transposase YbfD/YdcC